MDFRPLGWVAVVAAVIGFAMVLLSHGQYQGAKMWNRISSADDAFERRSAALFKGGIVLLLIALVSGIAFLFR